MPAGQDSPSTMLDLFGVRVPRLLHAIAATHAPEICADAFPIADEGRRRLGFRYNSYAYILYRVANPFLAATATPLNDV